MSDAIVVLAATVYGYLFTFRYQASYLDYFGINKTFVYIDLDRLTSAGGYIASVAIIIVALLTWPKRLFAALGRVLGFLMPGIVLLPASLMLFSIRGVTWLVVVAYVVGAPIFFSKLITLITTPQVVRSRSYSFTTSPRPTDTFRFRPEAWLLFLALTGIHVVGITGNLAGTVAAFSQQYYQIIDYPNGSYAIITRNAQSVIAVGVTEVQDEPKHYRLSSEVRFVEVSSLGDRIVRTEQAKIFSQNEGRTSRQSWREFVEKNAFWR